MNMEKYNWENEGFRKDPFKVPEGYFAGFSDRMMERLNQEEPVVPIKNRSLIQPWMAWVSGIAAVMVFGWFGLKNYYLKPLQETRFQEGVALFVDYYGGELQEGQLADYIEDFNISIPEQTATEENPIVQMEPELTEEYIYESVGL